LENFDINLRKKDNVYSFYDYEEIEILINYKYHKFGNRIINRISKIPCKRFSELFSEYYDEKIHIIPIDDNVKKGFSHTAILAKNLKNKNLIPYFNVLKATNKVRYAGKTLKFRFENPRGFVYRGKQNIKAVLVDDIKTTGTTLNEAEKVLNNSGVEVLFSVVLSDKSN
jgi:competence protein ComFC